jgi:hypothetical protein
MMTSRFHLLQRRLLSLSGAGIGLLAIGVLAEPISARAQDQTLKGEAALKHPAVIAALKGAELVKAGKIDEAYALRTKEAATEWKAMSVADRRDIGAGITERTPDPKAFADAIRTGGELSITGTTAVLRVQMPKGTGLAYLEREGGVWRISNGPMVIGGGAAPVNETRVEGAGILEHAIGTLALQYLDLIHAGKIEDAKKLATSDVQTKWKGEPASEKAESLAFLKKNLPTRATVTAGLKGGTAMRGVLIIEDDKMATLNLIVSEQKKTGTNTTSYSSTTTGIAFAKEGAQWKLAQ